jgi:hypothetical protein
MDDGKLGLNALNNLQRARDINRVHDSARKNKKEKRETEDGREFMDFMEDNEKAIEGFNDFVPQEPMIQAPSNKMLELLSTASGPPIHIEPIEEDPPADPNTPGTEGGADKNKE